MDASKQSLDSDQRHLLQISRPASVYSYASTAVPDQTPTQSAVQLPSGTEAQAARPADKPYRGFPSKEAYLSALTDFAQERTYFKHDNNLVGFYGRKTMDEYIQEGKKGRKTTQGAGRRGTVPDLQVVDETAQSGSGQGVGVSSRTGRRNSLAQLGRRVLGRQSVA